MTVTVVTAVTAVTAVTTVAVRYQHGRYASLPVAFVTCWCLFGIEELGHLIEQPFVGSAQSAGRQARAESEPYDFSLPVEVFASRVRGEVQAIAATAT